MAISRATDVRQQERLLLLLAHLSHFTFHFIAAFPLALALQRYGAAPYISLFILAGVASASHLGGAYYKAFVDSLPLSRIWRTYAILLFVFAALSGVLGFGKFLPTTLVVLALVQVVLNSFAHHFGIVSLSLFDNFDFDLRRHSVAGTLGWVASIVVAAAFISFSTAEVALRLWPLFLFLLAGSVAISSSQLDRLSITVKRSTPRSSILALGYLIIITLSLLNNIFFWFFVLYSTKMILWGGASAVLLSSPVVLISAFSQWIADRGIKLAGPLLYSAICVIFCGILLYCIAQGLSPYFSALASALMLVVFASSASADNEMFSCAGALPQREVFASYAIINSLSPMVGWALVWATSSSS